MKKMFSIALALVMLFALSVPVLANNTVTLYCNAPAQWSSCYVYWWGGAVNTEWPGVAMEKGSDGIWSYAIPDDAKNVIFSDNGNNQTSDLFIPTNGKNAYDVALKRWLGDGSDTLDYYLVGYIDGADIGIGADSANFGDYRFVNNQVTVSFTKDSYVLVKDSDGSQYKTMAYSEKAEDTFCVEGTEKMFVAGNQTVTFTLTVNEDGTLTMRYQSNCDHDYEENVTKEPTCDEAGEKTLTCSKCDHSYKEPIPPKGHQFVNGVCSVCNKKEGDVPAVTWYLVGYINGADIGIGADSANLGQYAFTDGKVTANVESDSYVVVKNSNNELYMTDALCEETTGTLRIGGVEKIKVPAGQSYTFILVENDDGTLTLSYQTACKHDYQEKITVQPTCDKAGEKTLTCSKCGHSYKESIPPKGHQSVTWYLVGYINGADIGIGADSANLGQYAFTDGKVTVNVESDSYVVVKNSNNELYMTDALCEETTGTLRIGGAEKIKVPAGQSYTFTLVENDDGTLTLSYQTACKHDYQEKITTEPTCVKTGEKTLTCSECGHVYKESIQAKGHQFANGVCSVCGEKEKTGEEKPQDNDPAKVTLFAKVPEGWTPVNAYTWEGETPYNGQWPGTAMQKDGNWFRIVIDAKAANVIINNGGDQKKTEDLSIKTDHDIYITVKEDGSAVIEYGAENKKENESNPPDSGENFPLSNFRVVGNAAWMGKWDPASDAGRMRQCGENRYFLQVKDVPAGTYEFKITENGTWDRSWGTKDGKNESFTLTQKTTICIYFELDGKDYKIDVDVTGTFGDVDVCGIVAIMGIAVLAAGALLLGRKKIIQ